MLSNDKYSARDVQQLLEESIDIFKMRPEKKTSRLNHASRLQII